MSDTNDKNIDDIIQKNQPQKKHIADVLFSTTDIIIKIHDIRTKMIQSINDVDYLSQLTPEQWAVLNDSLTNAEIAGTNFLNVQARLAEKIPEAQTVFNIIAGQINTQVNNDVKELKDSKTFDIPKEILPIQQAIQSTMDSKFGIDRTKIIEDYQKDNEEGK